MRLLSDVDCGGSRQYWRHKFFGVGDVGLRIRVGNFGAVDIRSWRCRHSELALSAFEVGNVDAVKTPSEFFVSFVEVLQYVQRHEENNTLAPWVEVLAWESRAFLYHHFLTQEECNHLIEAARPSLVKSTVVDSATGKSKDSSTHKFRNIFDAWSRPCD